MKQKLPALLLTVSLAFLLVAAGLLYAHFSGRITPEQPEIPELDGSAAADSAAKELRSAPDFTVLGPDGSAIRLSDYAGKPVVLGFWATWCPACRRELPAFQEMYEAVGDEVTFLMVNITTKEASQDSVIAFLEEEGYSFPVCYDTEADAMTAYVAYSLPVTYFINVEGKIAHQKLGSLNSTTLQEGIDLITSPD